MEKGIILVFFSLIIVGLCLVVLVLNYRKRYQLSAEQNIWQNSLLYGIIFLIILTNLIFYFIPNILEAIDLWLRVIPIIMGGVALMIAFLNFQRKSGVSFVSYYQKATNKNNHIATIYAVWLKNNKDKNELVYEIFLQKDSIKLVLKQMTGEPLNIASYETKFIPLISPKKLIEGRQYSIKGRGIVCDLPENEREEVLLSIKKIITESKGVYIRTSSGIVYAAEKKDIFLSNQDHKLIIEMVKE